MGAAERRLEMLKYLCKARKTNMRKLSEKFNVSVRTIHRDILELEIIFRIPLEIRRGRYGGGVYVMDNYSFDRAYRYDDELNLLSKVKSMAEKRLTEEENGMLSKIIKTYTKIA